MSFTGLTLSCSTAKPAGIQAVYLISYNDFTSASLASGSTTTFGTLTLGSGKSFKKYEFEQDQAEFRESVEGERGSYKVTHEIELFFPGVNATNLVALQEMIDESPCGFIAVVEDNNGTKWLVGYSTAYGKLRPMRLLTTESTTLKALGEISGATVTLQSIDGDHALTTTASIVTS